MLDDENFLQNNLFNDLVAKIKKEMMPCDRHLKFSGEFFSEGKYSGGGNLYATFKRVQKRFVKSKQIVEKLKLKC